MERSRIPLQLTPAAFVFYNIMRSSACVLKWFALADDKYLHSTVRREGNIDLLA